MSLITESIIIEAVDRSVVETIEAFVRFRPGFHGDTGIRDYLYHRLMTNLPDNGKYTRAGGGGTLLAQAEWYTELMYRNTGDASSRGRFDIGIPKPEELHLPKPRALVTFECGRNKRAAALLRDVDAIAEHEGPQPGDITKLAREICHKQLPYGYALEFFDGGGYSEAEYLIKRLRERISEPGSDRLRVVVLVCVTGSGPMFTFLPVSWYEGIRLSFREELQRIQDLTCTENALAGPRVPVVAAVPANRVSREDFLFSCSPDASGLIKAIEQRFGPQLKFIFGGNTMTVNRRPGGILLRITKAMNCVSDLDAAVSNELAVRLQRPIRNSRLDIEGTPAFSEAVIAAVARALDK